jgi:phosphatidylserine decarboxylase
MVGCAGFAGLLLFYFYWKRNILFFRDPKRVAPNDDSLVIAPCDGRVMYIKEVKGGEVFADKLEKKIHVSEISKDDAPTEGILIGIYMSPFDVHFNYAPISGKVSKISYFNAKLNLPMVDMWEYIQFCWLQRAVNMLGAKYQLENERNTIFIDGKCKLAMVEIADIVVNKIDCFVKTGDSISQGQKVSFIKRGSQVDIFLWGTNYEILIKPGIHTTGGVMPIAKIK